MPAGKLGIVLQGCKVSPGIPAEVLQACKVFPRKSGTILQGYKVPPGIPGTFLQVNNGSAGKLGDVLQGNNAISKRRFAKSTMIQAQLQIALSEGCSRIDMYAVRRPLFKTAKSETFADRLRS